MSNNEDISTEENVEENQVTEMLPEPNEPLVEEPTPDVVESVIALPPEVEDTPEQDSPKVEPEEEPTFDEYDNDDTPDTQAKQPEDTGVKKLQTPKSRHNFEAATPAPTTKPYFSNVRFNNLGPLSEVTQEKLQDALSKEYPEYSNPESVDFLTLIHSFKTVDSDSLYKNEQIGPIRNFIIDATKRTSGFSITNTNISGKQADSGQAGLSLTSEMTDQQVICGPMVASGFRLELSPITEDEFSILDQQLAHNLGSVGRSTLGGGLLFDNVFLRRDITNLILKHVTRTNVKGVNPANSKVLRELLKPADLKVLMTMVLAAAHADGFEVATPCPNCKIVHQGIANVHRMFNVDHGKLTDFQLSILTRSIGEEVTREELAEYQADFPVIAPYEFTQKGNVFKVHFGDRSLESDLTLGTDWANGISSIIDQHIASIPEGDDDDDSIRTKITTKLLENNSLTNYMGYVSKITKEVDGVVVYEETRRSVIHDTLKGLRNSKHYVPLYTAIGKFVFDDPVIIAIEPTDCTCGYKAVDGLIPVDVITEFFTRLLSNETRIQYCVLQS